jgi:hypothetical protein
MGRRSLEFDGLRFDQLTPTHSTPYHMRVSVRTGIEMIGPDHCVTSLKLLMFNTAAVSARTSRQSVTFSIRD